MAVEYQNQNILITECLQDNNNTMFVPSSQLMGSPMDDPFMFEGGENCILNQQDFCYYYYNNQLTPEEQALLTAVTTFDDNNNNGIYLNDQTNLTWSPEFELQDDNYLVNGSYSYDDDIIENENFDSYNPFIGQSPMYNDDSLSGGMLLTQPLSEVTQNVIANQQFNQYNDWCDLSPYSDTQQQYIIDNNNNNNNNNHNSNNISSKISEYNNIINNINSNNNINNNQNHYTAWTDFQLLEA